LAAINAFVSQLEASVGPSPLPFPIPSALLDSEGLDTIFNVLNWLSHQPQLVPQSRAWLEGHQLKPAKENTLVIRLGELPFFSTLDQDLLRPVDLPLIARQAQEVLRYIKGAPVTFSVLPRAASLPPSPQAIPLDRLLAELGGCLPRLETPEKVACDGKNELQLQLLQSLGYTAVDVGPDPLPDRFTLCPTYRKQADARLAKAEELGAHWLLTEGIRSLARWAMVTRDGSWRSAHVAPVLGIQLAYRSFSHGRAQQDEAAGKGRPLPPQEAYPSRIARPLIEEVSL
jgi:hypothetical protein